MLHHHVLLVILLQAACSLGWTISWMTNKLTVYCTNLRTVCLCDVSDSGSTSASINLSAAMESDDSDVRCTIWWVLLTTLSSAAPASRLWSLPVRCVTQIPLPVTRAFIALSHKHNVFNASESFTNFRRNGWELWGWGGGVNGCFLINRPVSTWMQTEN